MWRDVRYGFRAILRDPVPATVAIAGIAVAVALSTTVFSAMFALLLRPLPAPAPEELVYIYQARPQAPDRPGMISRSVLDSLLESTQTFSGLTGTWRLLLRMTLDDEAEMLQGEQVQPGYFEVLKLQPHRGRLLFQADYELEADGAAMVISHDLWRRRFSSSQAIIGTQVRLSDSLEHYFTIVGVAPPDFRGISDPWTPSNFWIPATITERRVLGVPPGVNVSFVGLARLQPGVAIGQAEALAEAQALRSGSNEAVGQNRLLLIDSSDVRHPYRPTATIVSRPLVLALVLIVVIVVCVAVANAGGVLMARVLGRSSEIATRRLLGQGGLQVGRQMLMEGMLLAALGGVAGLLLTFWVLAGFRAAAPAAYALSVSIDLWAVVITAGVCALCGAIAGLAAARQATRPQIRPMLASEGATTTGRMGRRLQHAIVLPQVTLSLGLMLVAGVYTRSLLGVELVDRGYETSGVLVVRSTLRTQPGQSAGEPPTDPNARAERLQRYYEGLVSQFQALPGVRAAISNTLPLYDPSDRALSVVTAEGVGGTNEAQLAMASRVSPSYFDTIGMHVLRGRDFDARDNLASPPVGVVSSLLAEELWPAQDPIGRRATIANQSASARPLSFEVVGVVNEVLPALQGRRHAPYVYLAMSQQRRPTMPFIVASGRGSSVDVEGIKTAVHVADPLAEVFRIDTLDRMVAEILYPRRIATSMLMVATLIALMLASAGVYGVISYSVARRSREVGVRRALGARDGTILRMIIGDGLKVAVLGLVLGEVVGYLAVRVTSARVLAVPQLDGLIIAGSPLVLLVAVVLASALPALRALRADPLTVLRRP